MTVLLLAQAALLYSSIRPEAVPSGTPLSQFPKTIGPWQLDQEGVIDAQEQAVLRADDTMIRSYIDRSGIDRSGIDRSGIDRSGIDRSGIDRSAARGANLYIAAFRSQRNGKAPHSPKNCLPGNGWTPLDAVEETIDVGASAPIPVNRYVIQHGESRSVVIYWYQSRDRAVASEYKAKFWVVADAIRLNRTDTALVRVIVPISNRDSELAEHTAVDFIRAFYGTIRHFLPS